MRRMSDTQTRTQQQQQQQQQGGRLALADLRTVKWVASQPLVKVAYNMAQPRYLTLKQAYLLGWFVIFNEMIVVWWWTFLHNLPWPVPALSLLHHTDSLTVRFLDFAQQRMEWVSGEVMAFLRPYMNRNWVNKLHNGNKRE